jgi:hypothetical protein
MGMGLVVALGVIAVLGVSNYFMFFTRRTVLRIFGWMVFLSMVGFIAALGVLSRSSGSAYNATDIINDLRNLRSAGLLFYADFGAYPSPGQEASLDVYLDRPIVSAERPRYAKVMLAEKSGDADRPRELYIGVELIPEKNGSKGPQQRLASRAAEIKLYQGPASGDIYKSGLSVYMRMR